MPWLHCHTVPCALMVLLAIVPGVATAEPAHGASRPWSVTALVGQYDHSRFLDILVLDGGDLRASYMGGGVVARELGAWGPAIRWEAEVQGYRHWGRQSLWETNGAVAVRWMRFPWDRYLDTSVSFGQGVSFASQRPALEEPTRRLLHYMHAELEFRPPAHDRVGLVGRLHHRSGAFGLYGVTGGSNFLTLGLRYRF
ncbi:MAG: hypothetical protein JJT90_08495 [Ectothiorhodospiraceae bacterium]|nr:hypothetical protein [Ectothiorhodospiraceae bacterium]